VHIDKQFIFDINILADKNNVWKGSQCRLKLILSIEDKSMSADIGFQCMHEDAEGISIPEENSVPVV